MRAVSKIHFASYGEFAQGVKIGPANWSFYDLLAIHEGQVFLQVGEESISLEPFDAVLIPPNTHFTGRVLSKNLLASVHHFDFVSESKASQELQIYRSDAQTWRQLNSSLELQSEFAGESRVACSALDLLLALLESRSKQQKFLAFDELLQQVRNNPQSDWSQETLAGKANLSISHFRKIFREAYDMPAGKFVQQIRLQAAARLLRETLLAQKEIAERIGYSDISHFHTAFRSYFKLTPGHYRKRHRLKF